MAESETKSPKGLKSAFGLFLESKDLVMKNLVPFAVLAAIPFFLSLAGEAGSAGSKFGANGLEFTTSAWSWRRAGAVTILGLAALVISFIVQAMLYVLALQTADGKKPSLDEIYTVTKKFIFRIFALSLIVGLTIGVGLVLLIVPGLIFIRRYYLSPYVLIDRDLSWSGAMKKSAELSKPYSGSIWGLIVLSVVLSLFGIIPVIGTAVAAILGMLFSVAPALRYRELQKIEKA
jgi:uncharacterized membrane protein